MMLIGKEKDGSVEKGLAHQVVSPLSNMSYRVYTDNYYPFLRFKTLRI